MIKRTKNNSRFPYEFEINTDNQFYLDIDFDGTIPLVTLTNEISDPGVGDTLKQGDLVFLMNDFKWYNPHEQIVNLLGVSTGVVLDIGRSVQNFNSRGWASRFNRIRYCRVFVDSRIFDVALFYQERIKQEEHHRSPGYMGLVK